MTTPGRKGYIFIASVELNYHLAASGDWSIDRVSGQESITARDLIR